MDAEGRAASFAEPRAGSWQTWQCEISVRPEKRDEDEISVITWKTAGFTEPGWMEDIETLAQKELGNGVPPAESLPARREIRLAEASVLQPHLLELPSGGEGGVARHPVVVCVIKQHI